MSSIFILLLGFLLGTWIGSRWRSILDKIEELEAESNETEIPVRTGPTLGSYHKINEVDPKVDHNPKKPRARVILPKTPQKVDWDAAQELNDQNRKFKVGPK